jgi:3-phosphoshikimate 1-carboxyvinyltransferase
MDCDLTGLHTLKIKETDRITALQTELLKFGAKVEITEDSLSMQSSDFIEQNAAVSLTTYDDHRMAMAFAPLCLKLSIVIQNAAVVSKSYPNFWKDLASMGVKVNIQ